MSDAESPLEKARLAAIREALLELQAEYAEGLPQLIADLTAAGDDACGSGDAVKLRHFQTLAHRMHGAGGSYGFKGVSAAAGELEEALAEHEAGEDPFDAKVRDSVLALLAGVRAAADRELASFAATNAGSKNGGGSP
jgi:HPt (histidine-containing phosphotransfer) domain-containing protein